MKTRKKILAIFPDMDGCMLAGYVLDSGQVVTPLKVNSNGEITNFAEVHKTYLTSLTEHYLKEEYDHIVIGSGSNRQSFTLEVEGAKQYPYPLYSYFALKALYNYFKEIDPQCEIFHYLTSDTYYGDVMGTSMKQGQEQLKNLSEPLNHPEGLTDEYKITLIYAIAHALASDPRYQDCNIVLQFNDDRLDILNEIGSFYTTHPDLLPKLTFRFSQYINLQAELQPLPTLIKGTGETDYNHEFNFKHMVQCSVGDNKDLADMIYVTRKPIKTTTLSFNHTKFDALRRNNLKKNEHALQQSIFSLAHRGIILLEKTRNNPFIKKLHDTCKEAKELKEFLFINPILQSAIHGINGLNNKRNKENLDNFSKAIQMIPENPAFDSLRQAATEVKAYVTHPLLVEFSQEGNIDALKAFFEPIKNLELRNMILNYQNELGNTLLLYTAQHGHAKASSYLCNDLGADTSLVNKRCLGYSFYVRLSIIDSLREKKYEKTATILAEKKDPQEVTQIVGDELTLLTEANDPVNIDKLYRAFPTLESSLADYTDPLGCSPLMLASSKGHVEIVKKLLLKTNTKLEDKAGKTALDIAIINEQLSVVPLLITAGVPTKQSYLMTLESTLERQADQNRFVQECRDCLSKVVCRDSLDQVSMKHLATFSLVNQSNTPPTKRKIKNTNIQNETRPLRKKAKTTSVNTK